MRDKVMNQDKTRREELNQVTEQIIGSAFTVSNELGSGFLEKVYENALTHELRKAGIRVKQQYPIQVYYDGIVVGNYVADLLVNDCVLVELKAIRSRFLEITGVHQRLIDWQNYEIPNAKD